VTKRLDMQQHSLLVSLNLIHPVASTAKDRIQPLLGQHCARFSPKSRKIQGKPFTEKQKAVFRKRGSHRFTIPEGSRWGDVMDASTNLGAVLTKAMHSVASANEELRGVFTVDWNQPAPDGSGKPLIPNEVVHALIVHFDTHDLSNRSVPSDVLGRAYEYLIKQFADDAGAKAGEFFTPPEVVDILVRILEPKPGDTIYDPTSGSGGMLVHSADFLREHGHHASSARFFAQEMNWETQPLAKSTQCCTAWRQTLKPARAPSPTLSTSIRASSKSFRWFWPISRSPMKCGGCVRNNRRTTKRKRTS
jgi:hypothetical protein